MFSFDPYDWYWQVDGRTDFWSSASGVYVETLPDGYGFSQAPTEAGLSEIMRRYGLRGPLISNVDVDVERDRRFTLGAPVDLGDGRTFVADIDDRSVVNITALALNATRAQAGGLTDAIEFRDHGNAIQTLAPDDVIALAEQAMARVSDVYAASWALKAMDPIPLDFEDGKWWPA